jgi:hypothetical protein
MGMARLIDANAFIEHHCKDCQYRLEGSCTDEDQICSTIIDLKDFPTVEVADMREFAEDVVYQFGYYVQNGGRLHITHGGLSTLEWAFDILGWENPHPVPECECEIEGCHEHATCGAPTADGYKRMCGRHSQINCAKMDGDGNG